ncbi:MAG: PAS domain S-box protein [Methylovulum sp.]|nr:PAS domain S-box protein [Methylovulum sp.]
MSSTRIDLRKQAEALLSEADTNAVRQSTKNIQKLLYEFQVHQIELELQNEELKHSQHELMLSRDSYASLYNSSPIGYLTLDEAGVIQKANPAAARLLGFSPIELVHKKFGHFISPSDQDSYYFFICDIFSRRTEQILFIQLNHPNDKQAALNPENDPDNTVKFIYLECRGIYAKNESDATQINLSMIDITETKIAHETIACLNKKLKKRIFEQSQALMKSHADLLERTAQLEGFEKRLIEREKKLNAIFNAAVEGIITINLSGAIISINDAVEKIFGYRKRELIGRDISLLIPSSAYKNSSPGTSDSMLHCVTGIIKEMQGFRKEGGIVPLDVSTAQFSIDGTTYLTKIVRDVSERKRQELRDQQHIDELAHVTRHGLMGEMASGIAHEVNQPLTAITSYAQTCLHLIKNETINQALLNETLQKTYEQALRAGKIIHRMREFVRSKKPQRSTADINGLIIDALALCGSYIKQHHVKPQLLLAKDLPQLFIDHIQIEQVILNLIKNSIDALSLLPPEKARDLSIQTLLNGPCTLEVRIEDSGFGIDENGQKNILTPFYTTKAEGMGMGLSISRSIIEAHEGTLRFNSQFGKGTTFYFTLPIGKENNGTE